MWGLRKPPEQWRYTRLKNGLSGTLQSLGSQQDLNYKVDSSRGRFVLKICRGDYAAVELQAQLAALNTLQGVRVPKVIKALSRFTGWFALRAASASPMKCRWAMAAWGIFSGAVKSRAWYLTSSPWPRAWATASRWVQ